MNEHDYRDESYHGSPIWICRFCDIHESDADREGLLVCNKAAAVLAREAAEKENQERNDYNELIRQQKRFEYLHNKFR